jgi:CRISPR-associated protein Csy1
VTSGLPTIDTYFSAASMEPADAPLHYRETLVALPGLGTAYTPPRAAKLQSRDALGLPQGRLYLVPQAAFKIQPDNDAVLFEVLARDATARVVLFDNESPRMTQRLLARLARGAQSQGIDAKRLHVLPMTSRERYLAINAACDVMIDTLHWSGGNTSLDAFAAGLPVVTWRGHTMRARQSAAMIERLGLSETLEVATPAALAERAVAIANDDAERRRIHVAIAANLPALYEGRAALDALVDAVERLLAGH